MEKYLPVVLKFVKTFLLFTVFKMALDWWRGGFGNFADIVHRYSGILVEAFGFAIVWMIVTKIKKLKLVFEKE